MWSQLARNAGVGIFSLCESSPIRSSGIKCMAWGNTHWWKTILFTDHAEWSTAQIVATYRDGWHVEETFRDMKQPSWLHWPPQFHWTDDKIRVHALVCVLAVTLAHLLRREMARAGIDFSSAYPNYFKSSHRCKKSYWNTRHLVPSVPA